MNESDNCPCGSRLQYAKCCRPYHCGEGQANTPEQLMRSRFSAFCLKNADYLYESLHPSKRCAETKKELISTFNEVEWLSLVVMSSSGESSYEKKMPQEGYVEFVAFHRSCHQTEGYSVLQLHEHSRFIMDVNKWYYADGKILPDIKMGRNDPCWCGSGKKIKKCHLGTT